MNIKMIVRNKIKSHFVLVEMQLNLFAMTLEFYCHKKQNFYAVLSAL